MKLYIEGNPKGKLSLLGEKFYEEFENGFWKKKSIYYIICFIF